MLKQQTNLLKFIAKKHRVSIKDIKKKCHLLTDYDFYKFISGLDGYLLSERNPEYDQTVIFLSKTGLEYVEAYRSKWFLFWANHLLNFFIGFISGVLVSVITALLLNKL